MDDGDRARSRSTVDRLQPDRALRGEVRTFDNPAAAEMVKGCHNIFNAKDQLLERDVAGLPAAGAGRRRHRQHREPVGRGLDQSRLRHPRGRPYGGACLPKDTKGFLGLAERIGMPMPLLSAVIGVNETMERLVARELSEAGEPIIELDAHDGQPSNAIAPLTGAADRSRMDLSALRRLHPARDPRPGALGGWLIRRLPAALYRPARTGHFEPLTVVVPVDQEGPRVFRQALESWLVNDPARRPQAVAAPPVPGLLHARQGGQLLHPAVAPAYLAMAVAGRHWPVVQLLALWWLVSRSAKLLPHLERRPSHLVTMVPVFIVMSFAMAV